MNTHRIIFHITLYITMHATTCMEEQPKTLCCVIVHNLPENSHCAVSQENNSIVLSTGNKIRYIDLNNPNHTRSFKIDSLFSSSIKTRGKNFIALTSKKDQRSDAQSLWIFTQRNNKPPKIAHKTLDYCIIAYHNIDFYPHTQHAIMLSSTYQYNSDTRTKELSRFSLNGPGTQKTCSLTGSASPICHPYKPEIILHKFNFTNVSEVYAFVDPRTNHYAKLILSTQEIGGFFDLLPHEIKNTILNWYIQLPLSSLSKIKEIYRADSKAITSIGTALMANNYSRYSIEITAAESNSF